MLTRVPKKRCISERTTRHVRLGAVHRRTGDVSTLGPRILDGFKISVDKGLMVPGLHVINIAEHQNINRREDGERSSKLSGEGAYILQMAVRY